MQTQEIAIPLKEALLPGQVALPPGARGMVIFAHGSGSSRHSPRNQFVAELLRSRGLGTLLFDLLTAQEERAEEQTRHYRFNIELLAERLTRAVRWTRGHAPTSGVPVGCFGASTGAAAAIVAAAQLGGEVRAIVSRGGRPDLAGASLDKALPPTLLIVGGADTQVLKLNQQAFSRLRGEKALEIIPGATHLFEEKGALESAAALAGDWFLAHLSASAGSNRPA